MTMEIFFFSCFSFSKEDRFLIKFADVREKINFEWAPLKKHLLREAPKLG